MFLFVTQNACVTWIEQVPCQNKNQPAIQDAGVMFADRVTRVCRSTATKKQLGRFYAVFIVVFAVARGRQGGPGV